MSSNTRYEPAPQRDSFEEEQRYPQAPPSYQATASGPTDSLLGGAPRGEDDNVPDDFKFGGSVAEATLDIRMQFIRKVYAILTAQILFTTGVSAVSILSDSYRNWVQSHVWVVYLSFIVSIGFLFATYWKRKSYPTNLAFLSVFTVSMAYAIGVVCSLFDTRIVLEALLITLGVFVFLTAFACQTKYDFTHWIPYLSGALWFLILFGFMMMFFPPDPQGSKFDLAYGAIGALVFSAYILVDTQLVIRHYHVEEEIAAAINLYLDVVNLFLAILRILNSSSNN